MTRWAATLALAFSCAAPSQEINIYSEFSRFNPYGEIVAQDRGAPPREILSPAVPRNGHLSVHVVVNAPAGTNYFLYAGDNPPGILKIRIYREHFVPCGADFCPDWLTEQRSPSFGAMPESIYAMPGQNTRCYLFDIWVPPDVPPRRIRVEALLKTAIWQVAPLEIRVIAPTVPEASAANAEFSENIADVEKPSSDTALRQLQRYTTGLLPQLPAGIVRLRDAIQRNAAEDAMLARAMGFGGPALNLMAWAPVPFLNPGAEWYLRARDSIFRYAP